MSSDSPAGAQRVPARRAAFLVAPILWALSSGLAAQTVPLPVLPEEPAAVDPAAVDPATPDPAAAPTVEPTSATSDRPPNWEYALGVGGGYESNVEFRVPNGPSSWIVSPRANVARVLRGRKTRLRIEGSGEWLGYLDIENRNTYDATFSIDGSYRASPRTTWRLEGSYDLGYSDSSAILTAQGVQLPLVKTRSLAGSLGVTRTLGQHSSLRFDARAYRVEFDEDASGEVALSDGQSFRGMVAFEQNLGSRDTGALEYSLEGNLGRVPPDSTEAGSYSLTHFGSLQWTRVLTPRSGLLVEAGGSYTPDPAEAGLEREGSFYGGLGYSRMVKRSRLYLFARREVVPAFGIGFSRLENRFGLDAVVPFGRAWTLRLTGIHVVPETPEGAPTTYASPDEAFVSLGRRLGRRFEISSEARYRRRNSTATIPTIDTFRAGLFVSLVSPNERSDAGAFRR